MEQKVTSPIVKGVIITLLLIIYGLVIYFTNSIGNKNLGYLQYVILLGGIIWSCILFAKQTNGNVTFGNVFAHGFKTTAVIAALTIIYTFISVKFLFPDIVDQSLDAAKKQMESQKNLSDEQMQQALDMVRKFFLPFAIGGIVLGFALIGAVASLIGAAVAKKNPQGPFAEPTPM
jgi:NADH:ubiquinone oxidoreductase subunit 6 (subunit J)